MPNYTQQVTGRLIDPMGSGLAGAQVYFTSKATTRGAENVPQTVDSAFTTDANGYYSSQVAYGWYKVYIQESGALEPVKIGVATVSGLAPTNLGDLIANALPLPTSLGNVGDVDDSAAFDGAALVYNASLRTWMATGTIVNASANLSPVYASIVVVSGNLATTGAALQSGITALTNQTGTYLTGNQRVVSTAVSAGVSGVAVTFSPAFPIAPKVVMSASFTGENSWLVYPRAITANGCSGFFSDVVTDSNVTLYTVASL